MNPILFLRAPWLWRSRTGAVSVEYAVVIGTLAAGITAAFTGLAGKLIELIAMLPI